MAMGRATTPDAKEPGCGVVDGSRQRQDADARSRAREGAEDETAIEEAIEASGREQGGSRVMAEGVA